MILWWHHSLSRAIRPNPALSLVILSFYIILYPRFFRTLKSPHPFSFIFDDVIPSSRAITPNPALSLVYHPTIIPLSKTTQPISSVSKITPPLWIYPLMTSFHIPCYHAKSCLITFYLSYYPSYNQDLFRTLKSPHPFEFIVWWRHSLSRAITPNPALSLFILSYHPSYNQDLFRTLKSPHPFEFIVWWRHSLSRAIRPIPALSLFILSYYPSYNQDLFRTLKSPHPFEFIVWWRHSLSRAITPNPALSLVILSYYPSYNQDFSEL